MEFPSTPGRPRASLEERFRSHMCRLTSFLSAEEAGLLATKSVVLKVEGSRRFRSPTALGPMRYEGCLAIIFREGLGTTGDLLMASLRERAVSVQVELGHSVVVLEGFAEKDTWVIYVTVLKPNVLLVSTNLGYMKEVFARISKHGYPSSA